MTQKTKAWLIVIAAVVLLVVISTGQGIWLIMAAWVMPGLLAFYVIGRLLAAVIHRLER